MGYDNNGRVADAGDVILRMINPEYYEFSDEIYRMYTGSSLQALGIVKTMQQHDSHDLVHEKHIISYPYEWPADMFRDAVLFHIKLFIELDAYGLTLKDALPSNIVFNFTEPVFIDFLSLIKKENICNEKWLGDGETAFKDMRFSVVDKMLIPFMLNPLLDMANKNYKAARARLSTHACNVDQTGTASDESQPTGPACPEKISLYRRGRRALRRLLSLAAKKKTADDIFFAYRSKSGPDFIAYMKSLYEFVQTLDTAPPSSGYTVYYDEKKENFDFSAREQWGEKQKQVYEILNRERPATVIDLGANTGWFSFLAERLGAKVIATDIDEACANTIYKTAKKEQRKILPLIVSFDDLTRQFYGTSFDSPEYAGRNFKSTPLFLAPLDRFHADLTMCLGLIHHLVLGMGHTFSFVFQVLAHMTRKSLVLEFVDIKDVLIKNEPSFFPNLQKYNEANYNIDLVKKEGSVFFGSIEVYPSHPDTRKLILFKNKKQ
jgi:SAM-dependent methyltransferase